MKTVWICLLLPLLTVVAHGASPGAPGGSGQPPAGSPSVAAGPASPAAQAGLIVLHAPSDRPARSAMRNDGHVAANLSTYLLLHKSWNQSHFAPTPARLSVCLP